ncbi:MAG: O-antigen ligase family protein [Desulfobulbaceae bacterium]|nr:O-antigen ligase family protein [Desulfobulbaceae bacterium]HIJ91450.1 O-antigen ligase family protein [Deltaproteobacteria bacterium]
MQQSAAPLRIGGISLAQPQKWERILWARVVPFFVLLYIALNPFPHTTTIREVSYYTAVALLLVYFLRYRDWSAFTTPFALPVVLFTGWACVGLFWALDFGASLHDIRTHLLKYILLFLLVTVFFNSRAKIRLLFWVIIVSVLISGFNDMYFFYVVNKNTFLTRMCIANHQLPVGPLGFMALFAAMLAVYLLRIGESPLGKYALSSCLVGLLLILFVTQMRSLMVALPFVAVALFWDNKKILVAVMLTVVLSFFGFFTKLRSLDNVGSYTDRLTINYMSLLMIKEHPIIGMGFSMETPGDSRFVDHEKLRGQVPIAIKNDVVEYTSPHNMWIGLAIQTGVIGLLLFLAVWATGIRMCIKLIRDAVSPENRLLGQLVLSVILLFSVYGLFNVVFMHFLELLLYLSFAIISGNSTQPGNSTGLFSAKNVLDVS